VDPERDPREKSGDRVIGFGFAQTTEDIDEVRSALFEL